MELELIDNYNTRLVITVKRNSVAAHLSHVDPKDDAYGSLGVAGDLDYELLKICGRYIETNVPTRQDLETIGQLLHRVLFTSKVLYRFEEEMGRPERKGKLCIELRFIDTDPRLSTLPWEYLCYKKSTGNGFTLEFVSTIGDLILSRYNERCPSQKILVPADGKELRVVIAVSNPNPRLSDAFKEKLADLSITSNGVRTDLSALRDLKKKDGLAIRYEVINEDQLSFSDFKAAIVERLNGAKLEKDQVERPHIIHFVCHGSYAGAEQGKTAHGSVAFVSKESNPPPKIEAPEWVPDVEFAEIFDASTYLPRVVFLHSCEGGQGNLQGRLAGVAQHICAKGVPTVVAMQYPITQTVGKIFSKRFYQEVAAGATIDEAVQLGRAELLAHEEFKRSFGAPVVYISTHNVLLVQKTSDTKQLPLHESLPQIGDPIDFPAITTLMSWANARKDQFKAEASQLFFVAVKQAIAGSEGKSRNELDKEIKNLALKLIVQDSTDESSHIMNFSCDLHKLLSD